MEERRGRVVLTSLPDEGVRRRVTEFLLRHARGSDRASLERGLDTCPVALTRPIPRSEAERVAEALRELGAGAVVRMEPSSSPVPSPASSRHSVGPPSSSPAETDSRLPPEPSAEPAASPPPPPVFSRFGRVGRRQTFLALLFLSLLGFVFSSDVYRYRLLHQLGLVETVRQATGVRVVTEGGIRGSWYYTKTSAADAPPAAPGQVTERTLLEQVESSFRVPHDRRLVAGMVEGARAFARLFAPDGPAPEVTVVIEPLGDGVDQITLAKGGVSVPLRLSSRPAEVEANLGAVEMAFGRLLEGRDRMKVKSRPVGSWAPTAGEVWFDHGRLIERTLDLDEELRDGREGARALLEVARQWAWAAFAKQSLIGGENAELAARQALAYYLIGAALDPEGAKSVRPPLLLALGYPDAARDQLQREARDDGEARLLRAYIERDIDGLERMWGRRGVDPRLTGFLLAAASHEVELTQRSREVFDQLAEEFPEARPLQLYYGSHGSVAQNRRGLTDYPLDIVEDHLALAGRLFDLSPITADADFQALARSEVGAEEAAEKWVAIHRRLFAAPPRLTRGGALLSAETVGRWLRGEMDEALYYRHWLEAGVLARGAEARKWRERVARIYGDSPLSRTLSVMERYWQSDYNGLRSGRDNGRLAEAVGMELEAEARTHVGWLQDVLDYPYQLRVMERYHQRLLPNAAGWRRLAEFYRRLYLRPFAEEAARNAVALAPHDPMTYVEWLESADGASAVTEVEGRVDRLARVQVALGERSRKAGRVEEAEAHLREALRLAPEDALAYRRLGELMEELGRYEAAIEAWSHFLESGDQSLTRVRVVGRIADLHLKLGRTKEALALYGEVTESGSGDAMGGFARASEAAGNPLEAERWFRATAERYPRGGAPGELALFYLRQGDEETARKVLREFRRYNRDNLYPKLLIEHFAGRGEPMAALALARSVSEGEDEQAVIGRFYNHYVDLGLHREAASAYKILADRVEDYMVHKPFFFGAFYLKSLAESEEGIPPEALTELLDRHAVNPKVLEYLGINLLKLGLYEAAYETFRRRFEVTPQRRDVAVVMMALARRLGGLDREPDEILRRLGESKGDEWIATRVRYLLGEVGEETLLRYANTPPRRCEVLYMLGAERVEDGDPAVGIPLLAAALATGASRNVEVLYAHELLTRLSL